MATDLTDAKASANPTKAFFVRMITKDLFLEDCILDLIDNSVDGAWRTEGNPPMGLSEGADLSKYSISIALSPTSFSIIDNCGGMTLDDAVKHAFSFGRTATEANQDYSIGVYGIGMKRAVFKLGTDVKIRSTFTDDNKQRLPFAVPINVPVWAANDAPPWDFDIEPDEPHPANGSIQHPRRPQIWQTTSSPTLAVASGWRSSIKSIPAGSQAEGATKFAQGESRRED